MKKIFAILFFSLIILDVSAQIDKLSGPRIGVTWLTPGSSADFVHEGFQWDAKDENGIPDVGNAGHAFVSQYGWQLESRFADGGEVVGIVEWIGLIAGMEQGLFLPSISSLVGLRTSKGIEFAAGPNLSLSSVGMVITGGYNFTYGKLNVPVNIAYVPSKSGGAWGNPGPTGSRFSLIVGFNLSK